MAPIGGPFDTIGPGHRIITVEEAERQAEAMLAKVSGRSRLTVKAAFRNGGKALVHLEEGASHEQAAGEVRAYLNRGATLVTVERQDTR